MPSGIQYEPTGLGPISNANFWTWKPYEDPGSLLRFVYDGLYRFDDHLVPIPDLASDPCDMSPDGLVFTCRLVDTTFHDGSPLTAEDVAFTYRLALAAACQFEICLNVDPGQTPDIQRHLQSVEVLGPLTVRFHLRDRWAPFVTSVLPIVMIDSRQVVTSQYDAFASKARTVPSTTLESMIKRIHALPPLDDPACSKVVRSATTIVASVGVEPVDPAVRDFPCDHLNELARQLEAVLRSTRLQGLEAVAAAYPILPFNLHPVGTGPWKVAEVAPRKRIILEAFEGYHNGAPKTKSILVDLSEPTAGSWANTIASHRVDIAQLPEQIDADTWTVVKHLQDVRIVQYAIAGYVAIQFNLRPGRLFADPNLREALARCIDKPAIVAAATGGTGIPIESDIAPSSWAYDSTQTSLVRDPAAARRLIEASGWKAGPDGTYMRGRQRLAAPLLVRADSPDRVLFATLVANQARECGFDIRVSRQSFDDLAAMISKWPHVAPGTKEPFEMYLGGWGIGIDPDSTMRTWESTRLTSASHRDDANYVGFDDPAVDRLIADARQTYDVAERSAIYRRIAQVVAARQPYIFGYAFGEKTILASGVGSATAGLDLSSPFWNWRLTDLVLRH